MIIRKGEKKDLPEVLHLIKALASFEKEPKVVVITVDELEKNAFGEEKLFNFVVAQLQDEIVGVAIYYPRFSTWKGRTIHLEDLIVEEAYRGQGIGAQLFEKVLLEAKELQVGRMEWEALEWNVGALDFYKKYGAVMTNQWVLCKLSQAQIQAFE